MKVEELPEGAETGVEGLPLRFDFSCEILRICSCTGISSRTRVGVNELLIVAVVVVEEVVGVEEEVCVERVDVAVDDEDRRKLGAGSCGTSKNLGYFLLRSSKRSIKVSWSGKDTL